MDQLLTAVKFLTVLFIVATAHPSDPVTQSTPSELISTSSPTTEDFLPHVYTLQDYCEPERTIQFDEQLLIRSQNPTTFAYEAGVNCTMRIQGRSDDIGLILTIRTLVTRNHADNLTLTIPGNLKSLIFSGDLYHGDSPSNYHSVTDSQGVELNWATAKRSNNLTWTMGLGFDMTVTACKASCRGHDTESHGCFKCATIPLYISGVHVCDGRNNCGDLSDERNCGSSKSSKVRKALISMTFAIAFLCAIIAAIVWMVKLFRKHGLNCAVSCGKNTFLLRGKRPHERSPLLTLRL